MKSVLLLITSNQLSSNLLMDLSSLVDIAYAPFIERFYPLLLDVKKYDITTGRNILSIPNLFYFFYVVMIYLLIMMNG
ncbi:unnamed protein product [Camellia sinensis]